MKGVRSIGAVALLLSLGGVSGAGAQVAVPASVVYTKANAPATPKPAELALVDKVTKDSITWFFEKPARVGQFVTGDWYVLGPVTVRTIDPAPLFGKDVLADAEWTAVGGNRYEAADKTEREAFGGESPRVRGAEKERLLANPDYCRNGSVLNLKPTLNASGFDSRVRHEIYDPKLTAHLPIAMQPGDTLVSTVSKRRLVRGTHFGTTAAVAILTCLEKPVPADTFRPGYCDRGQALYRTSDLKRELLPTVEPPKMESQRDMPRLAALAATFRGPWLEYNIFHEDHAPYQFAGYGQGLARRGGDAALMLCLDFPAAEKEPLLVGYLQFGIDLYGMLKAGYTGWEAWGGWNSGHKLPIILAGRLLGDDRMAYVSKTYPKASFQEDEQTGYGRTWTGSPVVFQGHSGVDARTGLGRKRGNNDWGPYEHLHPSQWTADNRQSDGYRRCCTSRAWVGMAIAAKLMKLEPYWDHPAFFDYMDRWMTEDETEAVKVMADLGRPVAAWARQGQVEIAFHEAMWKKYRPTVEPAPDAWRQRKAE